MSRTNNAFACCIIVVPKKYCKAHRYWPKAWLFGPGCAKRLADNSRLRGWIYETSRSRPPVNTKVVKCPELKATAPRACCLWRARRTSLLTICFICGTILKNPETCMLTCSHFLYDMFALLKWFPGTQHKSLTGGFKPLEKYESTVRCLFQKTIKQQNICSKTGWT